MSDKKSHSTAAERTLSGSYSVAGESRSYTLTLHELGRGEAGRVLSPKAEKSLAGKVLTSPRDSFTVKPQGPKRLGVGKAANR